ncbi:carbamoyl phosphate synthase small subunit [PVC group bacterium (ex Bugula neritina AB1)]|nr:carbamoyl phosphate synthase small subunit [PVC group bacterium (ex Bugula neritina AB1)]
MGLKKAYVVLEDGVSFEGISVGVDGEACGEMVFNTSMTGYQEILTDPSYAGQIMTMTYPLIGNYGVNPVSDESNKVHPVAFIMKEYSQVYSGYAETKSLKDYLIENKTIAIEGIDTRKLTKYLREKGSMRGIVSTETSSLDDLLQKVQNFPQMLGKDLVKEVTTSEPYVLESIAPKKRTVAVLDCGVKRNILNILRDKNCEVHVFPATSSAEDILKINPDGILISNGPGDPEPLDYVIKTVKNLIGLKPIFGICLGHQILSIALGGKTYKLKFGHRGANHPIYDTLKNKVYISSQNHGFCVDPESLNTGNIDIRHWNLNDKTLAGIRHKDLSLFSVQYHPEASPGPRDSEYLFQEFIDMMEG